VVVDISNPASPARVGAVTLATGEDGGNSIAVSGRYAYISTNTAPARVVVVDIRGTETSSLMAHSLEAGSLQVRKDLTVYDHLMVGGGINVGPGGIYSAGPLSLISGSNGTTTSALDIRNSAGTSLLYVRDDGNVGIRTTNPTSTLYVAGTFTATGTKSATVDTAFGKRKLFSLEAPEVRFIDEGTARLQNGTAMVILDPIFVETIEGKLRVHVTPLGPASLYVAEQGKDYFVVKSIDGSDVEFNWLVSAYRKGYAGIRLPQEETQQTQ
jgi:hypothetical protein